MFPHALYPSRLYPPSLFPPVTSTAGTGYGLFPHALFPDAMFPGRMFCPVAGSSVVTAPTFLAALRTYLQSVTGLSSLTGVYNAVAHADAVFPYAVVNLIGETPEMNNSGYSYGAWTDVQITVVTDDDVQGVQLQETALQAFTPKASWQPLQWTTGVTDMPLPGRSWQFHQPGTGPDGATVWLTPFMVRFYTTRTM